MRALALDASGPAFRTDWPDPRPAPGETLRARALRGDLRDRSAAEFEGHKGFRGVLGHEFVGMAESGPFAGGGSSARINCSCGQCETCAGRTADALPEPHDHRHPRPRRRVRRLHRGAAAQPARGSRTRCRPTSAVFTEPVAAAFRNSGATAGEPPRPGHRARRRPARKSVRAGAGEVCDG